MPSRVQWQRKEATKMAIKLQDAIDAIVMQRDEIDELKPTDGPSSDGAKAPDEDCVLCHESEEPLWPDVNMVQGEVRTGSEEGIMDANPMQMKMPNACQTPIIMRTWLSHPHSQSRRMCVGIMDANPMQEESMPPERDVAGKCMSNIENEDMVDEIVPPSLPIKEQDVGHQVETSESNLGCLESAPQVKLVEVMNDAEQDITHVTREDAGGDATHGAEEEVDQNTFVDDMNAANHGYAQEASSDRLCACLDVVQEVKGGLSQDVELSPDTPTAAEKCNYSYYNDAALQNQLQGPLTPLEKLTDDNCSLDDKGSPTFHRHDYENCNDVAYENPSGVTNSWDEAKAQSSTVETPSPPDSAFLLQLSEDCKQLRSLVGKLLAQNKAQSKVLWALGERLELLEHQQQLNCQQQMCEKRKLRKGSKRSVKCRNCE